MNRRRNTTFLPPPRKPGATTRPFPEWTPPYFSPPGLTSTSVSAALAVIKPHQECRERRRLRLKSLSGSLSELPPAPPRHPIINDRSVRSLTPDGLRSMLTTSRRRRMDYTTADLFSRLEKSCGPGPLPVCPASAPGSGSRPGCRAHRSSSSREAFCCFGVFTPEQTSCTW